MNTRAKGRRFERFEAKQWESLGWEVEVRHPSKFVGPGHPVFCDYFDRYDVIAVLPKVRVVCFIQVSTEPPSSHKNPGPMGLRPPFRFGSLESPSVEELMMYESPSVEEVMMYGAHEPGVYEVYARYAKNGRKYEPRRIWWIR